MKREDRRNIPYYVKDRRVEYDPINNTILEKVRMGIRREQSPERESLFGRMRSYFRNAYQSLTGNTSHG